MRKYRLPQALNQQIQTALRETEVLQPKSLAANVLRLSDFYQNPTGPTPFKEKWAQSAYLCYFLPLNFIRNLVVIEEGKARGFFSGLEAWVDYGAAMGASTLAMLESFRNGEYRLVEPSRWALDAAQRHFGLSSAEAQRPDTWIFSYSLNEMQNLPKEALQAKRLMIIEPSTRELGRNLLQLRQDLMEKGFFPWAPCTHLQACPLLVDSKRDWCHSRIGFEPPEWFLEVEEHLPMKNSNLTYSFLLMSRQKPSTQNSARLVGDLLPEKGRAKILVCRNEKREFLTFLDRQWPELPALERDKLIEIHKSQTALETRIQSSTEFTLISD